MEKLDLDKLVIHISKTRKPTEETQEQLLKSIAILGYCIDKRLEQQNLDPAYASVFKKNVRRSGQTVSVIIEFAGSLLKPAAEVAEGLSKRFPEHCSAAEWRARAGMFQHVSVKDLRDIREGMLGIIRGFKHAESWREVNKAFHYLEKNHPGERGTTLEKASEHWLKAMLKLKEAEFTYYAAKEAADMYCFSMDKDNPLLYGYYVDCELQQTNLPSTWDNTELKTWRAQEATATHEKEQLEADYIENRKQRENAEPQLIKLIEQGMSDPQIQSTLEIRKKPRQLIRDLMFDVSCLRLRGIERHKPPKIVATLYGVPPPPTKKPPPLECPPDQHWSDKLGMCVEGPEPKTEADPRIPKCPDGQYWNGELGTCMPIKRPQPEQEKQDFLKTPTVIGKYPPTQKRDRKDLITH